MFVDYRFLLQIFVHNLLILGCLIYIYYFDCANCRLSFICDEGVYSMSKDIDSATARLKCVSRDMQTFKTDIIHVYDLHEGTDRVYRFVEHFYYTHSSKSFAGYPLDETKHLLTSRFHR